MKLLLLFIFFAALVLQDRAAEMKVPDLLEANQKATDKLKFFRGEGYMSDSQGKVSFRLFERRMSPSNWVSRSETTERAAGLIPFTVTVVSAPDGVWIVKRKQWKKLKFMESEPGFPTVRRYVQKESSVSISETNWNGAAYWLVEERRVSVKSNASASPPGPSRIQYFIGKTDSLFHRSVTFNRRGKPVEDFAFTKMELNRALPGELFDLSKGAEARVFKTEKEFQKDESEEAIDQLGIKKFAPRLK